MDLGTGSIFTVDIVYTTSLSYVYMTRVGVEGNNIEPDFYLSDPLPLCPVDGVHTDLSIPKNIPKMLNIAIKGKKTTKAIKQKLSDEFGVQYLQHISALLIYQSDENFRTAYDAAAGVTIPNKNGVAKLTKGLRVRLEKDLSDMQAVMTQQLYENPPTR
jgi:hypothetical protein